jgi:hypothetical protein
MFGDAIEFERHVARTEVALRRGGAGAIAFRMRMHVDIDRGQPLQFNPQRNQTVASGKLKDDDCCAANMSPIMAPLFSGHTAAPAPKRRRK